jgi:hypothetical protein
MLTACRRRRDVITELRRYRIKPGQMASWVRFFHDAARENEAGGCQVEFAGVDRETNTFIWLRTYADEADRERRKSAFYDGAWWLERETFAMDHVLEYDVTFLETAMRRSGGTLADVAWPHEGERPGARADAPPDGWSASTRKTFVRG